MVLTRSQKAAETEAKLSAALEGITSGKYATQYQAAKALGLSTSTLARRFGGGKSRADAREHQQALSEAEEKALAGWITRLTLTGHPARHDFVRDMAEEIRKQRAPDDDDPPQLLSLGLSWVQRFLKRHPHLHTTMSRSIELARVTDVTKEKIMDWFEKLETTIEEYQITIENTYNMDETGTTPIYEADCRVFHWNSTNSICCRGFSTA